jgi:hypothetical protein
MADKKVSVLPAATALSTADRVPIVQAGANKTASFGLIPYWSDAAGTKRQLGTPDGGVMTLGARAGVNLKTTFGAVGGGADDTAAFNAFRTWALAQGSRWVELTLPPDDYGALHGKWLKGIQNVIVHGYGATFTNLGAGGALDQGYLYGTDTAACCLGDTPWQDTTDPLTGFGDKNFPPAAGTVNTQAYLINATAAGAVSVTTATAADAGNFSIGDDVLVYGYNQQGAEDSFPPNARYFEYRKVVSRNAGTGEIVLDLPLRNRYRTDWTDRTTYLAPCGAARISRLTRTRYQLCQNIVINGLEFLSVAGYTNATNGIIIAAGARSVKLVDVKSKGISISECEKFKAIDSVFVPSAGNGANETDKGCDRAIFDNCIIPDHAQATGINYLEFDHCTLTGTFQARPRHLTMRGNIVATKIGSGDNTVMLSLSGYSAACISLESNDFFITDTDIRGIAGEAYDLAFVVNTVVSPTEITVVKATYPELVNMVEQQNRMHTYDVANYVTGVVTDFFEDATLLHIQGVWNRPVTVGMTLNMLGCQQLFEKGNRVANKPNGDLKETSIFRTFTSLGGASTGIRSSRYIDFNALQERILRPYIIKNMGYYDENINGFITKITVHVQRAYTGVDASCALLVAHETSNSQRTYGFVDCKTVGLREWTVHHAATPLGGDYSFNTIDGTYCDRTQVFLDSTTKAGSDTELPLVSVWIEAIPAI